MNNNTMVLLGATGNLAKLKIYPALTELYGHGDIDDSFNLIGVSEDDFTQKEFATFVQDAVGGDFNLPLDYVQLDIMDDDFDKLSDFIKSEAKVIFYLSIPPSTFQCAIEKILRMKNISKENIKVMLEKPYGMNYDDTVKLNKLINENHFEDHVHRIDHYLAKSGIEKLAEFKKNHADRWNNQYIDEITVAIAETVGIEERIDFYRETGAIVDVVQNHIFQLLLRIISDGKNKDECIHHILDSLDSENCYFKSKQYLNFETETMFYGSMHINSSVWENVIFNIITGKRMTEKATKIEIKWDDGSRHTIDFIEINKVSLSEYSVLILDCIRGNNAKFVSSKEAEATWLFGNKLKNLASSNIEKYQEGKVSLENVLAWINLKR